MAKATVYVRKLNTEHQRESMTKFLPLSESIVCEIKKNVKEIFDLAGGAALLKSSGDVYIKPNGIDAKPYCYVRPEVIDAVMRYWFDAGAKNVYLFENSTQCNFTRLVFETVGYTRICRQTGAQPIYLDEDKRVLFTFGDGDGDESYTRNTFEMPQMVKEKLIDHKDENLYIDVPKLKTHSMAGVTLGIKNQWAFPRQNDRRSDHNHLLASKLADVLKLVRPDFTLIEGVEGTIYGHYPVTALADKCVIPFMTLIGSANVLAADIVGAKVFGLELAEVDHLRIAAERGLGDGVHSLEDIEIDGDISRFTKKYPTDLYNSYPKDVNVVMGKKRCCKQGCQNNPLTLLQVLYHDYGGTGGWDMVMGEGHDLDVIDKLKGPVLIVGYCAINEVGDRLIKRLGKRHVYQSGYCNDLTASAAAMFRLMKVNPLALVDLPPLQAAWLLILAKLHGSKANVPALWSKLIKTV